MLDRRSFVLSTLGAGSLLACGIFSMWLFQIFINVGMTLGIMPVTGIPLPFMSYGGTALVTLFFGIGVLMSIQSHRMLVKQ